MKRWKLLLLIFPLGFGLANAQVNMNLNSSNPLLYDAVFHNPAAITYPHRFQGSFGIQYLYTGLSSDTLRDNTASLVLPLSPTTACGLRGNYFLSNMIERGNFSILFAQTFFKNKLSFGVNCNLINRSYNTDKFRLVDIDDPLLSNGTSKNVFSLGGGILFQPVKWLSFGASADHLNQPDISIDTSALKKDIIYKFGTTVNAYPFMSQIEIQKSETDIIFQGGIHYFMSKNFCLSLAYDSFEFQLKSILAEIKLILGSFAFSYDYQFPLNELNRMGTARHKITIVISKGGFPIKKL